MKIKVANIKVAPNRARKKFENIAALANSIQEFTQLQPIVIDRDYNLVIGERRLRAVQLLGWDEIDAEFKDEVEEWRKKSMELEENLQRENLTFAEEVEAKLRLHEIYQERYGKPMVETEIGVRVKRDGWTVVETSELLGESEGSTVMDLQLARAIREDPTLASKDSKAAAYKTMKSRQETSLRTGIAKILAEDSKEEFTKIILGDSREVLKGYEDESFDFCVTDPPWGINLDDEHRLEFREAWGEFKVDGTRELSMQAEVFKEVYRVLRPGAHCYVFYASLMHQETLDMLVGCGFGVRRIPLIWVKTKSLNLSPYTAYSNTFEPIFFCYKGKPKQFNFPGEPDVFIYPTPKPKVHPTSKSPELIKRLVENCSVENEIGLDPFLGGGTFSVACKELNRRSVGIEIAGEWYIEALKGVEGV